MRNVKYMVSPGRGTYQLSPAPDAVSSLTKEDYLTLMEIEKIYHQ